MLLYKPHVYKCVICVTGHRLSMSVLTAANLLVPFICTRFWPGLERTGAGLDIHQLLALATHSHSPIFCSHDGSGKRAVSICLKTCISWSSPRTGRDTVYIYSPMSRPQRSILVISLLLSVLHHVSARDPLAVLQVLHGLVLRSPCRLPGLPPSEMWLLQAGSN
jgi:hypothetical protein